MFYTALEIAQCLWHCVVSEELVHRGVTYLFIMMIVNTLTLYTALEIAHCWWDCVVLQQLVHRGVRCLFITMTVNTLHHSWNHPLFMTQCSLEELVSHRGVRNLFVMMIVNTLTLYTALQITHCFGHGVVFEELVQQHVYFPLERLSQYLKTLFNIVEAPFKIELWCICCMMMFRWTNKQPGIEKFWNLCGHY